MENLHHKPIKKFGLNGIIKDESTIARIKQQYVQMITLDMKSSGYALRLDLGPDFTIEYSPIKECFYFVLSMYGTYVGKKQSKWITGIDGTRIYTQENKLKESLQGQESTLPQK